MSLCFPGVINHLEDYSFMTCLETNSKESLYEWKIYTVRLVGSEGEYKEFAGSLSLVLSLFLSSFSGLLPVFASYLSL